MRAEIGVMRQQPYSGVGVRGRVMFSVNFRVMVVRLIPLCIGHKEAWISHKLTHASKRERERERERERARERERDGSEQRKLRERNERVVITCVGRGNFRQLFLASLAAAASQWMTAQPTRWQRLAVGASEDILSQQRSQRLRLDVRSSWRRR